MIKATCSCIEDQLEKDPQYQELMVHLSQYTKRLATMRAAYEYVAATSMIVQRISHFLSNGGELRWPHETLKTGYTPAGLRRIIMSHLDFMYWIVELHKEGELSDISVQ